MTVSWKNVNEGSVSVAIAVGTDNEKRFKLPGIALTANDLIDLCESVDEPISIRGAKNHVGGEKTGKGNAKRGGVRFVNSGEENGDSLAAEMRAEMGMTTNVSQADKDAVDTLSDAFKQARNGNTVNV